MAVKALYVMATSKHGGENGTTRIVFDEEEELELQVGNEESSHNQYNLCLVGRFLIERMINFIAMKHRMVGLWSPRKNISIDHDLYIF